MKIMVFSDTHGHIEEALNQYKIFKDIDFIIHLGDCYSDAQRIKEITGAEVICIKGNTDGENSDDSYKIINIENHSILLTHGHMEKVKNGLMSLFYKASSLLCDIVLFGHTHIPVCQKKGDILFVNPGSLTIPKGSNKPSFALMTLENDNVLTEIVIVN